MQTNVLRRLLWRFWGVVITLWGQGMVEKGCWGVGCFYH